MADLSAEEQTIARHNASNRYVASIANPPPFPPLGPVLVSIRHRVAGRQLWAYHERFEAFERERLSRLSPAEIAKDMALMREKGCPATAPAYLRAAVAYEQATVIERAKGYDKPDLGPPAGKS